MKGKKQSRNEKLRNERQKLAVTLLQEIVAERKGREAANFICLKSKLKDARLKTL